VAFLPASSLPPGTVTIGGGTVAVTQGTNPWLVSSAAGALATEETLATVSESLDDVALTAILQRERLEVT
jgi:hypothetical protein